MEHQHTFGYRLFSIINYIMLSTLALLCILPVVYILALSFSSGTAASAGMVGLWPVEFTTKAYEYILDKPEFLKAFLVSIRRILAGVPLNMLLTILVAYPLSKETSTFRFRTVYAWVFVFTILFNGGLIPWFMVVKATGLINNFWALIIPSAVQVFNIILLLNFFRGLPKELEEAGLIDGAGQWMIMWRIFVPLSMPALATLMLFTMVHHWNSWFDGLILMNHPKNYPMSTYLQTVLIKVDMVRATAREIELLLAVSNRTAKAAQIFLAALPIILVYPFLQRFFVKGIVMGSVKG